MQAKRSSPRDESADAKLEPGSRPPRRGARPWPLGLIYLALILAPLGFAAVYYPIEARPSVDELASALGLVAFAALLVEFLFSGRHRWISGRIGLDNTVRIHRWVGYAIVAFIVIHPFLYAAPDGSSWPWFNAADATLPVSNLSLASGLAAFILVAALVLTAIDRDQLPWSYEIWRIIHAAGAVLLGVLIFIHAITASGYSTELLLVVFWLALLSGAVLSLIHRYLLSPLGQRRTPYVVQAVDKVGERTWAVQLRPERNGRANSVMRFRAGQFAWLKLGRRAFATRDHPFSISTSATDTSTIGFTIKEKGDFTDVIGELAAGTRVWLDGPHGHLVADEKPVPSVYIVAGTGIGPALSHLHSFKAENDPRPLTLIYSVATDEWIPHREELEQLAQSLDLTLHFVVQHPSADWHGAMGPFNDELLDACLPQENRPAHRYFVCGPVPMGKSVHAVLRRLGIPASRILTGS